MSINAHAGHGFYHALLLILLCFNMAQKLSLNSPLSLSNDDTFFTPFFNLFITKTMSE